MYDLHHLGWSGFQQLCLTILREVLGQTVESFLDTNDGGRDGAFAGRWKTNGTEDLLGKFVVQCKFTSRVGHSLTPSDVTDELEKITKLVRRRQCDCYVLMTNAGLSATHAVELEAQIRAAGAKQVRLLSATWIEQIRENKRLRMLVPRVYGLGDLTQILDERVYAQARAILESLREDLAKVVVTETYRRAAAALDEHSFVLLIGEPAAGKSTIASLLSMVAIDHWGSSILKLQGPDTFTSHWNPEEPTQFFWLDDAFGVTQYEQSLVHGWNHALPQVKSMLRHGAKIVMTSRDYIYNRARHDLKEGAFPLLRESQVVIDVHELSQAEKQQILYNHLKLGRQPSSFKTEIKPYLQALAAHPRFIPETARRLAEPLFTTGVSLNEVSLAEFVERREGLLQDILQNLDAHSKAALALIFMRGNQVESPIVLQTDEEGALKRMGSELGGCIAALQALSGSLVSHTYLGGAAVWQFKHPTIADAFAKCLLQSPELLGIYLQGSEVGRLLHQITCGDVGIERAVIIPGTLFPLIIEKFAAYTEDRRYKSDYQAAWQAKAAVDRFLATRCSREFLTVYLQKDPKLLDRVSQPGRYLNAVSEVDVAIRLNEHGLMPESSRKKFVETVWEYTLAGEDLFALESPRLQSIFHPAEFKQMCEEVRTQLLPRLDDVTLQVECDRSLGERADDYMQPYLESLSALRTHFKSDAAATAIIEREIERAETWITEHLDEDSDRTPRTLGSVATTDRLHTRRSIFDDVDT